MHNMPGITAGTFAMRIGPIMAAADHFPIEIDGRGGHAARPHDCIDPILVGAQTVSAAHSVVSRNVDRDVAPMMGSEDFAFMLQKRPGAYIFLG